MIYLLIKLKVMSFNVRLFDLYNWSHNEETKSKIISFIKNENRYFCFQEYYYDSNNDFVTRELILKELEEYYHESFTNETLKNAHFGLAILVSIR